MLPQSPSMVSALAPRTAVLAMTIAVGAVLSPLASANPAPGGEQSQQLVRQAQLTDDYQASLQQLEQGSLKMLSLLLQFSSHELETADLVRKRVYDGVLPEPVTRQLAAIQAESDAMLAEAKETLAEGAFDDYRDEQLQKLRKTRDQLLMDFISEEIESRDMRGEGLLLEMQALLALDDKTLRRLERKKKRLTVAQKSLVKAFFKYDISDHRLSSRIDRFKEYRMDRIALLLSVISAPAQSLLQAQLSAAEDLELRYKALRGAQAGG